MKIYNVEGMAGNSYCKLSGELRIDGTNVVRSELLVSPMSEEAIRQQGTTPWNVELFGKLYDTNGRNPKIRTYVFTPREMEARALAVFEKKDNHPEKVVGNYHGTLISSQISLGEINRSFKEKSFFEVSRTQELKNEISGNYNDFNLTYVNDYLPDIDHLKDFERRVVLASDNPLLRTMLCPDGTLRGGSGRSKARMLWEMKAGTIEGRDFYETWVLQKKLEENDGDLSILEDEENENVDGYKLKDWKQ